MVSKILKIRILVLFVFVSMGSQAQEAIVASGGDISGSGGVVSYSVGQLVYNTYIGTNGSIMEGIQQPFEIFEVSSIEEAKDIELKCIAYPNPVTDFLVLKIETYDKSDLSYLLFDMNGKLLHKDKIKESEIETRILVSDLVRATYFLKVVRGNQEVKTFKIIKK